MMLSVMTFRHHNRYSCSETNGVLEEHEEAVYRNSSS